MLSVKRGGWSDGQEGAPISPTRAMLLRLFCEREVIFDGRGLGRAEPMRLQKGVPQVDPSPLVLEVLLWDLTRDGSQQRKVDNRLRPCDVHGVC